MCFPRNRAIKERVSSFKSRRASQTCDIKSSLSYSQPRYRYQRPVKNEEYDPGPTLSSQNRSPYPANRPLLQHMLVQAFTNQLTGLRYQPVVALTLSTNPHSSVGIGRKTAKHRRDSPSDLSRREPKAWC